MDQITEEERRRIAELVAGGAPPWKLHLEINRSRHAIRRAVVALYRPAKREPQRSPLRLSLADPDDPGMRVSHETSYLSLFVQARGVRCARSCSAACGPGGPAAARGA